MRRALALLLALLGGAALAVGVMHTISDNCDRVEREANAATAALDVCSRTMGCRFEYRDIIAVARQRKSALQCEARRE